MAESSGKPGARPGATGAPSEPAETRDPIIRAAPLPSDCNANGDIFGGWVLAQMDIAGGVLASRHAGGRVVTKAIQAMTFDQPIRVGDVVSIYGEVVRVGRTSVTVRLETIVRRQLGREEIKVTGGDFVYVAIDGEGRPRAIEA